MIRFSYRIFSLSIILLLIVYNIAKINPSKTIQKSILRKPIEKNNSSFSRIFCFILTTPGGFKQLKPQTVHNVWASKCDGYSFLAINYASNLTGDKFSFDNFILQPDGFKIDVYGRLTEKVFYSIRHIYNKNNYYDWYMKADDDTYIQMENLREFLKTKNPNEPITYGRNFKIIVQGGYHSGGAGYILSREAFNRLGEKLSKNFSSCQNTGVEDVDVATCLRTLNVQKGISIDAEGKERFFPFSIDHMYKGGFGWLESYAENFPKSGFDCCSDSFISFHYMQPIQMIRLDSVVKQLRNNLNESLNFKQVISNYLKLTEIEQKMSNS